MMKKPREQQPSTEALRFLGRTYGGRLLALKITQSLGARCLSQIDPRVVCNRRWKAAQLRDHCESVSGSTSCGLRFDEPQAIFEAIRKDHGQ
jgi:hypothetical protein